MTRHWQRAVGKQAKEKLRLVQVNLKEGEQKTTAGGEHQVKSWHVISKAAAFSSFCAWEVKTSLMYSSVITWQSQWDCYSLMTNSWVIFHSNVTPTVSSAGVLGGDWSVVLPSSPICAAVGSSVIFPCSYDYPLNSDEVQTDGRLSAQVIKEALFLVAVEITFCVTFLWSE